MPITGYGPEHRVNIVKKAKVDGKWNFFPAVVESNGKLKDKIRVRGSIEVHTEGAYYLQWREGKVRFREPVPDKLEVLERARRKRLEIDATKAGIPLGVPPSRYESGITLRDAVESRRGRKPAGQWEVMMGVPIFVFPNLVAERMGDILHPV